MKENVLLVTSASSGIGRAVALLAAQALSRDGRLDAACNNAGIGGVQAPLADDPLQAWDPVVATKLSGLFYGMKYQIDPVAVIWAGPTRWPDLWCGSPRHEPSV